LFAALAHSEMKWLRHRVAVRRLHLVWPRLTFAGVRLGVGLVEARRDFIAAALGRPGASDDWREPNKLEKNVRHVAGFARLKSWSEHYNAACVYAIPLLADARPGDEKARRRLAELAIGRLELAVRAADSRVLAGQRTWLLSEDPDLDALRREIRFKRFEVSYLPSPVPTPTRPKDVKRWEMTRYIDELVVETARRWEDEWHRRGRSLARPLD